MFSKLVLSFALFVSFFVPTAAFAQGGPVTYEQIRQQGVIFAGICTSSAAECPCRDSGDCEISDILQVMVNIITLILSISGSLALLMFVYGGFLWLISGGNAARVEQGKQILVGALIGLVIIFTSYSLITIVISLIRTGQLPSDGQTVEDVSGATNVIDTQ